MHETKARQDVGDVDAAKNALAPVFTNLVAFLLSEYSVNWKGSVTCRLDRIFTPKGEVDIAGRMIMVGIGHVDFVINARDHAKTIMPLFAQIAYRIRIGYFDT
jgi:hypothetical protein